MNQRLFFRQRSPYYSQPEWYETYSVYEHLCLLFDCANQKLIKRDVDLLIRDSSETAICGALMLHLKSMLWGTPFSRYNVDIEYNRNFNERKKIYINHEERSVICDLIVHSRGRYVSQDNLIAIEMKKEYRSQEEKQHDRERLIALTRPNFNNWYFDGTELPPYVCRYILGVYYEIREYTILLEYYRNGTLVKTQEYIWNN